MTNPPIRCQECTSACVCVSLLSAVCMGSPEAPTAGSFYCGSSSVAGSVCNGTCSTGGGPITATCDARGNWTVQGTCTQPPAGGKAGCLCTRSASLQVCIHVARVHDGGCYSMCRRPGLLRSGLAQCCMHCQMTMMLSVVCLCGCLFDAVCTGSPEAPSGGSFDCGNNSTAGAACNGTCSTGGGPITATCEATGNWTVQGTCAQPPAGEKAGGVLGNSTLLTTKSGCL